MKKRILIVEDDDLFRTALRKTLEKDYEVTESPDGRKARELVGVGSFDLIISDIQMPHFSGVDLLEWTQKNKPTPVILMTGFSHILETKKATELGASEFLAKPFQVAELQEKIVSVLGLKKNPAPVATPGEVDLDAEFCKLPIEDFVSQKETEYPIFIRLSPQKYIKIAHTGGKLSLDKVVALKDKGVHCLYIRQEDFHKLVGFTVLMARAVNTSGQVDHDKKVRFLTYTGEMIAQQAFVGSLNQQAFSYAKDFLQTSIQAVTEDKQSFDLINLLSEHTDTLYAHSLAVSLLSVMIGREMGWQSPQVLFKLAFGGLYHDIGKKEIPKEVLEKSRALLSADERKLIESHALRGKEILEHLKTAPSEVIDIAYGHHENRLGLGYPRNLPESRIHPLCKVVIVANTFCELVIPAAGEAKTKSASEALIYIERFKVDEIDSEAFDALKRVIVQPNAGKTQVG